MLYFDTSALVKVAREEEESPALRAWLAERGDVTSTSSALVEVELPRALRRAGLPDAHERAARATESLLLIEITPEIRRAAARLPDPMLRSLDAIHLASAYHLGRELTAIVTYDRRLARAVAGSATVASPGAEGAEGAEA
jgi:hypothetical protein